MVGELLRETSLQGTDGFLVFLDGFVDGVSTDLGLSEELTSNIVISVSEALNNAFVHGNNRNANMSIALFVYRNGEDLIFHVRDQGQGYDYALLTDDVQEDLLDVPGGRGLFIMRALADEVSFNDEGNEVYLTFRVNGN